MSTYYGLRTPMTKKEMRSIGVKFDDGLIVEKSKKNYLHPQYVSGTEAIYGFTRYAGSDAEYLIDILEKNNIEWMCEYDLDECYPIYEIAEELGIELDDEGDLFDEIYDAITDNDWYAEDYYWAMKDGKSEEYIKEWCNEHKDEVLEAISTN